MLKSLFIMILLQLSCAVRPTAKIAAYGDSVTWGYGAMPGGWADELQAKSGYEIANLGVPGETSQGGVKRIDRALAFVPGAEVFLLKHGGNDWISIFRGDPCRKACEPDSVDDRYVAIGDNLRIIRRHVADQDKRVVFSAYWPSSPEACSNYDEEIFARYNRHLDRLNAEIIKIAAEHGDAVIRVDDLAEIGQDGQNWHDCLHPSRKGYALAADRWMEDITLWEP